MPGEPGPPRRGALPDVRSRLAPDDADRVELVLDELGVVTEPVSESASLAPAVGIAVTGGAMLTLPREHGDGDHGEDGGGEDDGPGRRSVGRDSLRAGLTQAGPVAVAGLVVNGAAALVVVAVAHVVSARTYGAIAQLLGLFFIISMPGSAVLVGVVRRVTALQACGRGSEVWRWAGRVHRLVLAALAFELVVVWALQGWIARELSLPNDQGVVLTLVAGGVWIFLSVDRGLLQSRRRYNWLAGNLVVEGAVRFAGVLVFVFAGMGVGGYALGLFLGEVIAAAHAHWLAARAWSAPEGAVGGNTGSNGAVIGGVVGGTVGTITPRRDLIADVSAAFVGLALLGLLQNVDVILLGRLDHHNAGAYAAISVASKALVFGALALGSYLLPEATIRWNEGGHALRQLVVTLLFLAVPAVLLLGIAVVAPHQFLTLVFSAKLSDAAPAFVYLVVAMLFLCVTVLLTNYLFGAGRRWIVAILFGGSGLAVGLVAAAKGRLVATAKADLVAQAALAVAMTVAFAAVHYAAHVRRCQLAAVDDPATIVTEPSC